MRASRGVDAANFVHVMGSALMKTLRLSVVLSWCWLASVCQAAAKDDSDPQEDLKTAIPAAIQLLEDKEYETFLKKYVPPEDLEQITKKTPLAELAQKFGSGNKASRLLATLQAIKDSKPKIESNGKKAVFELKESDSGKQSITFIKIDKLWYVQN